MCIDESWTQKAAFQVDNSGLICKLSLAHRSVCYIFDKASTSLDTTSSSDHALLTVDKVDVEEDECLRGWRLPRLNSLRLRHHVVAQAVADGCKMVRKRSHENDSAAQCKLETEVDATRNLHDSGPSAISGACPAATSPLFEPTSGQQIPGQEIRDNARDTVS